MYDRKSDAFANGLKYFLQVAEQNKRKSGFMDCPCNDCKNEKNYSNIGTLHGHLIRYGFMRNYVVWTRHGERGVMMEEDEKEEDDDDYPPGYGEQGGNDDTAMDEGEEEVAAEEEPADDLGQVIRDARRDSACVYTRIW